MFDEELRIGIVGCGNISREHVKGYQQAGNARIVKVFDVHRAGAEKLASELGAEVAETLEELANPAEIDAVSICTPPTTHLQSCLPFLEAGIPILCEKPFEGSIDQANLLQEAIEKSDSQFMIAFCHRFNPCVKEAKRLLDEESDLVGTPLFFRNIFGGWVDISAGHRSDPSFSGGGVLIDNCSHSLDLFRHLMGEVESISARVDNIAQTARVEDFASIDVQGNGCTGQIVSSYSLPLLYNTVEIYCSKSMITINYWVPKRPNLTVHIMDEIEERAIEVDASISQFAGEIGYFLDCVRNGTAPSPGIEDAVASAVLIDAAYRSAREERRIEVPSIKGVLAC